MLEPTMYKRAFDSFVRYAKRPVWSAARMLTGKRLQMPLHIYDLSMYAAAFDASAEAAQHRVGSPDLRVVEHSPGRTEVQITALDYRDAGILLPYRELAIAVPVEHRGHDVRGFAVLHLPVTTEDARWGGVENFGFPKFVAHIEIDQDDRGGAIARLEAEGVHVLTLRIDPLKTKRDQQLTHTHFTLRDDGQLIESDFHLEVELGSSSQRGGARLELGAHAIAAGLRELGVALDSRSHQYAPRGHAHLTTGRVVGELGPRVADPATTSVAAHPA